MRNAALPISAGNGLATTRHDEVGIVAARGAACGAARGAAMTVLHCLRRALQEDAGSSTATKAGFLAS